MGDRGCRRHGDCKQQEGERQKRRVKENKRERKRDRERKKEKERGVTAGELRQSIRLPGPKKLEPGFAE